MESEALDSFFFELSCSGGRRRTHHCVNAEAGLLLNWGESYPTE
jgi:hypothetical protein